MSRARIALVFVVGMLLVVPVPYSGERESTSPGSYPCTSDWEGVAPLPMAAYEAVANDEPPLRYGGESATWCG